MTSPSTPFPSWTELTEEQRLKIRMTLHFMAVPTVIHEPPPRKEGDVWVKETWTSYPPKTPPPAPYPLGAPPSMEAGRRWRARNKPKTLSYWLQTALGMIWLFLAIRGSLAIPKLAHLNETDSMQDVITCSLTLLLVSVTMLVLHFKLKKS